MEMSDTGRVVYERTYSRTKPDGTKETWPETVYRVAKGNFSLVYGDDMSKWPLEILQEFEELQVMMLLFKMLPAGRHLWASGVPGRQYLFNCHVSGWNETIADHFEFTFLRLMEGGGVGANYSNKYLAEYPNVRGIHEVHIVCDPEHPDYQKMKDAGIISDTYDHEWAGAFEVEDSREGWAGALVDLIDTYYRPALNIQRVFDVSRVRPEGSRLKTFGGRASGPLPLGVMLIEIADVMNRRFSEQLDGIGAMEIDHAIAKCVVSGGNRRSARMAIMHWADPQILDFISIKQETGEHWTTNISVEVDDEFFERLGRDIPEPEDATPEDVRNSQALVVLHDIAEGMLTNGEPGFWNSTLSNVDEPNRVTATNPCGEIALEAWENCNLGHVNLAAFVDDHGNVDTQGMAKAHILVTRFLIRATYGDVNDPKQAEVLARNRRIGVGHLGVASYLAMTGVRYSEAPVDWRFEALLEEMAAVVDRTAQEYSHSLRIPVPVKTRTVAPTGTIAKLVGVSEGIHPIFARYFLRRIRFSDVDPDQMLTVKAYEDAGYGVEPDMYAPATTVVSLPTKDSLLASVERIYGPEQAELIVESASDISLEDMLAFQSMYQEFWADNAVSYTVNIDPEKYTVQDLADAIAAFGPGLKGGTVFPEMSMPQSPYQRITKDDYGLYEDWQTQVSDGVDEACANGGCPIK